MKKCHNYSNLAYCQILFYVRQQPMKPNSGTQYEENQVSHHRGMFQDGQLDRWTDGPMNRQLEGQTDGLGPFLYSLILLLFSGEL